MPRYSSSWNSVAWPAATLPSAAWPRSTAYMPSGVWPVGRITRRCGRARSRFATSSPPSTATRAELFRTSGVAAAIDAILTPRGGARSLGGRHDQQRPVRVVHDAVGDAAEQQRLHAA